MKHKLKNHPGMPMLSIESIVYTPYTYARMRVEVLIGAEASAKVDIRKAVEYLKNCRQDLRVAKSRLRKLASDPVEVAKKSLLDKRVEMIRDVEL